jgi:hypothetical protein
VKSESNQNVLKHSSAADQNLDRGIEKLIARELSDMVDYQSLAVDVQATRRSIKSAVVASTYFSSQQSLAKILTEGAD